MVLARHANECLTNARTITPQNGCILTQSDQILRSSQALYLGHEYYTGTNKGPSWTALIYKQVLDFAFRKTALLIYSRTSMARTLTTCLPCLTRTRTWVPMIPYMRFLWSNFRKYVLMLLFYFLFLVTVDH